MTKSTLPLLIFVLAGKGGVGKTLLSLVIADLFDLAGLPLDVIQIDDQQRLAKALGREVTSIDIALLRRARKDPSVLTKAFGPMFGTIEAMRLTGRSVLVDIGATQQHSLYDYALLTELATDLDEFGIRGKVFVPALIDPESLRQAAQQLGRVAELFPMLDRVLVLNARDGAFDRLLPTSEAGAIYTRELTPMFGEIEVIEMPAIAAGSWGYFERSSARMIDVVSWDVPTVMAVSGLSRPEAKLARGDVAAFFATIETELARVLPIGRLAMADRRKFQRSQDRALSEREQGRDELFQKIMAMPPDRRWTVDSSIYSRLSADQLRRVLADTSGDSALVRGNSGRAQSNGPREPRGARRYREPGVLRRMWRRPGVSTRAALVGIAGAMIANVGLLAWQPAIALIRPPSALSSDVNRWPRCPRLDRYTDACLYVVQERLRWSDATELLVLPLDTLRATNRHLGAGDPLPRGAVLVVWRGQLRLE